MLRRLISTNPLVVALLGCFLAACSPNGSQTPQKVVSDFVVDGAKILTVADKKTLTDRLASINRSSSVTILVRTVILSNDTSIEMYANNLYNQLRIGKDGRGALLVVAPNQKQFRIEVGRGLEGSFPDHIAQRSSDIAISFFKKGRWYSGLDASITNMLIDIERE